MIGQPPKLDFRCLACGYGVARLRPPERCPMCTGTRWRLHPRLRVAGGMLLVGRSMPAPGGRAQSAGEA